MSPYRPLSESDSETFLPKENPLAPKRQSHSLSKCLVSLLVGINIILLVANGSATRELSLAIKELIIPLDPTVLPQRDQYYGLTGRSRELSRFILP